MDIDFNNIPPLLLGFLIAFAAVVFIQLVYYWVFFSRVAFYRRNPLQQKQPPVSVVITAHNQYNYLSENLPFFLEQDYPDFEVVVVNDTSDDDTGYLLKDIFDKYPRLHTVDLRQNLNWFKGRKFPLSIGIKAAKYDLLVLTDIDCKPAGYNWLSEIVSAYQPQTEILLAYSTYKTSSWMNRFLRFMSFYDALFYMSMALAKMPFKGIGKNLSYEKGLFYRQNGFISHYIIPDGDGELFVNKAAKAKSTSVLISPESKIMSVHPIGFFTWLKKEKARLSLRRYFKFRHRFNLSFYAFSSLAFYGLFATLFALELSWIYIVPVFALRFISQMFIYGFALKKFSEKGIWLLTPFFEVFIIIVDLFIWLSILVTKRKKWA